ncbi:MAG: hypothetical protein WD061_03360 [Candidatus Saccharimonadales bacterium]
MKSIETSAFAAEQITAEILAARLVTEEIEGLVKELNESTFITPWCSEYSLDRGIGICLTPYADESSSDNDYNTGYFIQIICSEGFKTIHSNSNETQMRGVWGKFIESLKNQSIQIDPWNHRDLPAEDSYIIPHEQLDKVRDYLSNQTN